MNKNLLIYVSKSNKLQVIIHLLMLEINNSVILSQKIFK